MSSESHGCAEGCWRARRTSTSTRCSTSLEAVACDHLPAHPRPRQPRPRHDRPRERPDLRLRADPGGRDRRGDRRRPSLRRARRDSRRRVPHRRAEREERHRLDHPRRRARADLRRVRRPYRRVASPAPCSRATAATRSSSCARASRRFCRRPSSPTTSATTTTSASRPTSSTCARPPTSRRSSCRARIPA